MVDVLEKIEMVLLRNVSFFQTVWELYGDLGINNMKTLEILQMFFLVDCKTS